MKMNWFMRGRNHLIVQSFKRASYLKLHFESVHEGKKKFMCKFCDNKYVSKRGLQHYIAVIHEGKKPLVKLFKCSSCEKSFKNLKLHFESVHEGKKKFVCKF